MYNIFNAPSDAQFIIDESFKNLNRMLSLATLPAEYAATPKGITPKELIWQEDTVKVFKYKSEAKVTQKVPMVLVFAMINRPYIMDLKQGKSMVQNFLNAGFDTYLLDWGDPTPREATKTTSMYVDGHMLNAVREVCHVTGSEKINLLGYCMGGMLSVIFAALYPELVNTLTTLTTAIDCSRDEGAIGENKDLIDAKAISAMFGGNLPAKFMQLAFMMADPVGQFLQKPRNLWNNILLDPKLKDEFLHMEQWLNDPVAVPGTVYVDFVTNIFQKNQLALNQFVVGGRVVDLRNVVCPLLNIIGEKDDIVLPSSSTPLEGLVGSTDKKTVIFPVGHVGIGVSGKSHKQLWPMAIKWLADRS